MVSNEPQDGRCNANVVDKVGLEVHDDVRGEMHHTGPDGRLEQVVLERGAVTAEKEPEYQEVISYLREGFDTIAVDLAPSDDSESDGTGTDLERVPVEDDDPYVTNQTTDHLGFCERYPVKSTGKDVCPVHGGLSTGAPEGNTNRLTHGLRAKRSNYYENEMSEEEKIMVEDFVDDWLSMSDYDRDNSAVLNEFYRIAVDQIRLWNAQDEFSKGIVYDQYEDTGPEGDEIFTEQENPANLPYDRLDRTTFKKLKDLGVLDDPDSQQAEATESLAAKFADIGDD